MSAPLPSGSLSVVIPVYNEPDWIGVAVRDLARAVERSPFAEGSVELVIVDDGSDRPTVAALDSLVVPFPKRVIHQSNSGRFAARKTGVEKAAGEFVLLIDSRVSLAPDSLAFAWDRIASGDRVWNAHVDIDLQGNPFARFWNVLTEVAFSEYFGNPRTTSYGVAEFDRFPKGTTGFLAPRDLLLGAIDAFRSSYEDLRDANDDTILIRWIAERERIWISPSFRAVYRSPDALRRFLRHAYHRGGVFVDGYGRPGTRFFPVIAAFFPASALALFLAARKPRFAAGLASAAPVAAATGTYAIRRSAADSATMAVLAPVFAVVYGAGMWRGLWLATQARYSRLRAGR
jgi:glycosyltransferase involved in cell wall biosynthesis